MIFQDLTRVNVPLFECGIRQLSRAIETLNARLNERPHEESYDAYTYAIFQSVSVGYEIRFESQKPRDIASITFCTTGIVFQKLRTNPELLDVSHIILDEVHERDLHTDVLLGVLKNITRTR